MNEPRVRTAEPTKYSNVLREMAAACGGLLERLSELEPDPCAAFEAGRINEKEHDLAHDLLDSAMGLDFLAGILDRTEGPDGTLPFTKSFMFEVSRKAMDTFDGAKALIDRLSEAKQA